MISVTPQGNVYLCKTPLEEDYKNQLTFNNIQEQENYFNSKVEKTYSNYTYIKKDNVINVSENIDNIITCNYLFYRNTGFTNKIYYCFITNMRYINENCTEISFTTDVIQTWYFQIQYKQCFIEREHTNDDTIGKNTYPEGLETGEYIVNSVYVDPTLDDVLKETCYVIGTTVNILASVGEDEKYPYIGGAKYNGVYSGVKYYSYGRLSTDQLTNILGNLAKKGQADTTTGLFIVPSILGNQTQSGAIPESDNPVSYNISVSKSYGLDGYIPHNNKLKTYPYCYLLANNMGGATNVLRYEDFATNNCDFNVKGVLCPGGSFRLVPKRYKGATENDNEALMLGKYPICNYSTDSYTNWLTQNSINIGGMNISSDDINMARTVTNTASNVISNIATGNVFGLFNSATNGMYDIGEQLIAQKQHSLIPPAVHGDLNSGDVLTASGKNNFRFFRMSAKKEYLEKIDRYFDMYGYKTNLVKLPNITGRRNWNYIKTLECNYEGNIPQQDLNIIRNVFNRGITFWHNPNTFFDYSQNNDII